MIDVKSMVSMAEYINKCFANKDVEARVIDDGGFILRIEERDIQFDENLKFVGQGSNLMYVKPKQFRKKYA